ncbi:hypothetical protein BC826DRAFT_955249 [Russula brevipes]|nr:hypothetical protein BC826DRAFT_955249 [Russula brevipes]
MTGAPPQQSPQITHTSSQPLVQPHKIPPLPEERFKNIFMQFTAATGIRFSERDLVLDGRPISLWALHRTVFMRNGFDSVTTNDEWPIIGGALGFPPFSVVDAGQPPRCAPAIAHRLRQIYNDLLRQFDQAYINSVITRIRNSQASGQIPPQALQQQQQSILPRFSYSSALDLEAHRVPQYVIDFVEQNREHLQRAAQGQNGFRAGLASTKGPSLDSCTQVNQASALQALARPPPQLPPGHPLQQVQVQRQALAQGQGKPNSLQPAPLFNAGGPLARPSTSHSMSTQMTGPSSSGGLQIQGGAMSVPMNPGAVNSSTPGSVLTQPMGTMQIRRPTQEEVAIAKRWVDEQKRLAFSRGWCCPVRLPDF